MAAVVETAGKKTVEESDLANVVILDDGAESPTAMRLLKLLGPGRPQYLVLDPRSPSSILARFGVPPETDGFAPTGMNFSAFNKDALDKEVRRAVALVV